MDSKLSLKDYLSLIISVAALLMSMYVFLDNNFINQHSLKTSVVSIDNDSDSLSCTILIVNAGKIYETLYSAKFIFSDDLNAGGGRLSKETIGPFVIPPKQAIIAKLTTKMPSMPDLKSDGIIPDTINYIHMGILFNVIDVNGDLPEDSKIYKITELKFTPNGDSAGASPKDNDDHGMLELL